MNKNEFEKNCAKIMTLVRESETIVLAPHLKPDGDAIGSILGFACALGDNEKKQAFLYSADKVPTSFSFMQGYEEIAHEILWYPDLLIGFDYGDFSRLGVEDDIFSGSKIATFDHHPLRGQVGDACIIDIEVSSTTELLYNFMKAVNWKISSQTAQCLLTGIVTDTGGFSHNIGKNTFLVSGDLIQKGASLVEIYKNVLSGKEQNVLNVWGSLLARVKVDQKYNFLSIYIPFEQFKSYNLSLDEITGIVSVLNRIVESAFSLFVVEHAPNKIKGSLRGDVSKGVPVSSIAERLGGGGHKYAAGFSLDMPFEKAEQSIIMAIQETFVPA